MRGEIISWRPAGWGFIEKNESEELSFRGRQIFLHIHNWEGSCKPEIGMMVFFKIGHDKQGRECAVNVKPVSEEAY
ncbi:MAG: cold shock domain-containing protein [Thermoplasmatales archaeon]|nr:MAG: cold shock domain-containing protein [Thermoplasmatales archaeon]